MYPFYFSLIIFKQKLTNNSIHNFRHMYDSFLRRKIYCVTDNMLIKCGIHSNQALSNTEMEKLSVIYCVSKTPYSKKLSSIEHQLPLCNKANLDNCTQKTQSRVRMGKGGGGGRGYSRKKWAGLCGPPFQGTDQNDHFDTLFLTKISKNPYPW